MNEALAPVQPAFTAIWKLTKLQDNWDGEGAVGYAAATAERAMDWLSMYAQDAWSYRGVWLPAPTVGPADYGSIDLHWPGLLVNIPPGGPVSFYGEARGRTLSGTTPIEDVDDIIMAWLLEDVGRPIFLES
jgi:hypothetical protein